MKAFSYVSKYGLDIQKKKLLIDQKPKNTMDFNLEAILNLDNRAEKYINKNFGYSLLDVNRDIIWTDKNSQKFFEIPEKK